MKRAQIAAVVAVVLVLGSCSGDGADAPTTVAVPSTTTTVAPTTTTEAPTTTTWATQPWTPGDFEIELIVLESECFDTAGALTTVSPVLEIPTGRATPILEPASSMK